MLAFSHKPLPPPTYPHTFVCVYTTIMCCVTPTVPHDALAPVHLDPPPTTSPSSLMASPIPPPVSPHIIPPPLPQVGAIVPWNWPFHNVLNPLVAAVFAGNAIVIKVGGWIRSNLHLVWISVDVSATMVTLCSLACV